MSSGVVAGPPGVNRYSFRECLLDNGFFSKEALSGIARADSFRRHQDPRWLARHKLRDAPTAPQILEMKEPAFVFKTAQIIANGLMPGVEYWQDGDRDGASPSLPGGQFGQRPQGDLGANTPYILIPKPLPYPQGGYPAGELPFPASANDKGPDWRLNRFLDCYIAPVGAAPSPRGGENGTNVDSADHDIEGRLLRAHILLVLLSRFGTQVVISHASSRQVAQAELLLGHVKDAEKALRSYSAVWNPQVRAGYGKILTANAPDGKPAGDFSKAGTFTLGFDPGDPYQPSLRWYEFVTRLLRVMQVAVDIERIDTEQSLDRFGNLLAAFSGPIKGFGPILKDSISGFAAVQKTRLYGDAYLRDARETLRLHTMTTRSVVPSAAESSTTWTYNRARLEAAWKLWDAQLAGACQVLAGVAQKDESDPGGGEDGEGKGCVPSFAVPKPGAGAGAGA